ncbi:MAG: hypothetical protein M1396_04210 [Chloroflexi bacterium]|nr:hypothetical protein [Chloroflexota bacterium]
MMTGITYKRQFRTPSSETYILVRDGRSFGRLDLHFGGSEVCGTLVLDQVLADKDLMELIEQIDEDLVLSADTARDDLQLTVFKGEEILFYTDDLQQDEVDSD